MPVKPGPGKPNLKIESKRYRMNAVELLSVERLVKSGSPLARSNLNLRHLQTNFSSEITERHLNLQHPVPHHLGVRTRDVEIKRVDSIDERLASPFILVNALTEQHSGYVWSVVTQDSTLFLTNGELCNKVAVAAHNRNDTDGAGGRPGDL